MEIILICILLIIIGAHYSRESQRHRVHGAWRAWQRGLQRPPPPRLPSRDHVMAARRAERDAASAAPATRPAVPPTRPRHTLPALPASALLPRRRT